MTQGGFNEAKPFRPEQEGSRALSETLASGGSVEEIDNLRYRLRQPGMPREALRRPRLDHQFDEVFAQSVALAVCAAPGSGKTVQAQLYAQWALLPTAWITLDASHASPGRLLAELAEALAGQRRPDADIASASAFRLEATVEEAAALVAGSIRAEPALLVIDECEHLDGHAEAQAVLETFLEYHPDQLRVLLLSRADLTGALQRRMLDGRIRLIGEMDLRLSRSETQQLAELVGGSAEDTDRVYEATGGWTAGAAFSFRYGLSVQGVTNDLPAVIMSEVLARLPDCEQRFLLDSSVPEVLTREVAVRLCGPQAHALWEAVRARHLPATTSTETTLRFHALFRSFLHRQLLARYPERHRELSRAYADYLFNHSQPEQATECYLSIGDLDRAADAAEAGVMTLCSRSDWATVLRWTDQLGAVQVESRPLLVAAQVRSLFGRRRFEETVELIRRLDRLGKLRVAAEADHALLATAAWALQADLAEAQRLLDRYEGDYRAEVVRFLIQVCTHVNPAVPPLGSEWGDMERIMCWGLLLQGRLSELAHFIPADPDAAVVNPNVILASVFSGDHAAARSLWGRVPEEIRDRPQSHFIEALLLLGEGETELALSAVQVALSDSRKTTFFLAPAYQVFSGYILLKLGRFDDAIAILQEGIAQNAGSGQTALLEWGQAYLGYAMLLQNSGNPVALLNECVRSMVRSQRRLFLPFAATCLAEAEARRGDLEAAHSAADLAYHSASMIGSFATITPALNAFPSIPTREEQCDPACGMRWRRLVVAPSARPPRRPVTAGDVHLGLQPFGPTRDISVNGEPQHIGRMKIVELLAYLVIHPDGSDRSRLQDALFPEASLRNGGNHFRQIAFKFRQITGLSLDRREGHLIGLPVGTIVDANDVRFEELLRTASWVTSSERVLRLRTALDLVPGPYLGGSNLAWAEERRNHLDVVQEEARLELVRLLLELGRPEEARRECEALIALNRYSDPGYRLLVQIERLIGSESSVLAAYRQAVLALEELGLVPGDARTLLETQPSSSHRSMHAPQKPARRLVRP